MCIKALTVSDEDKLCGTFCCGQTRMLSAAGLKLLMQ
jgi:hypothetical protein